MIKVTNFTLFLLTRLFVAVENRLKVDFLQKLYDSCFLCFEVLNLGINHFSLSKQFSITLSVFSLSRGDEKVLHVNSHTEGNLSPGS